jgi:hypothetical protein
VCAAVAVVLFDIIGNWPAFIRAFIAFGLIFFVSESAEPC